jgi:hypothetical protein
MVEEHTRSATALHMGKAVAYERPFERTQNAGKEGGRLKR